MIREIIDAWKGKAEMEDIIDEFLDMVSKAQGMYDLVIHAVVEKGSVDHIKDDINRMDKELNHLERSIRRKIVHHLSMRAHADVAASLVMMSVVKDMERIGDYIKNALQAFTTVDMQLEHGRYMTPFLDMMKTIEDMFGQLRKAFRRSDPKLAKDIISKSTVLNGKCDLLLTQLIKDELPTDKAVIYTLLSRYTKRISSHLRNVATSIVMPVDRIDYTYKKEQAKSTKKKKT
jgi:phosphate uptake regulator